MYLLLYTAKERRYAHIDSWRLRVKWFISIFDPLFQLIRIDLVKKLFLEANCVGFELFHINLDWLFHSMRDDPETPESSDFEIPAVDETYDRKSYLYF